MSLLIKGGGSPGGANTQVQFNDGGAFGGSSLMTFDKATGQLSATQFAGGDFLFDNLWRLTEGDKIGKDADSLYLLNAKGMIMAEWKGKSVKDALVADKDYVCPARITKADAKFITDQGIICPECQGEIANIRLYSDNTIDVMIKGKVVANGSKDMEMVLACSKGHSVNLSSGAKNGRGNATGVVSNGEDEVKAS
ncbi:MAG: hypothetical protein PHI12_11270 [Dehalococcoidales bacterium]|nr:hypothetical protein [Dehalococcoidales bacterium]